MDRLTKQELVKRICGETHQLRKDVSLIVQAFLDSITAAVATRRNVTLRDFGTFEATTKRARIGRNPKQPEIDIIIPPRAVVKFKTGKTMRERVSQLHAEEQGERK